MNYEEANNIPGMIELVERKMLFEKAREVALSDMDCIVEFGAFFGRSTNCIAQGLSSNPKYSSSSFLYTYDSFECDVDGWFAPHVHGYAQNANILHLINVKNGRVDFEPVFKHYLDHYIKSNLVISVKSELVDSHPPENSIALMHIDSPKYYEEFKIIFYRFFPKTKKGSIIIFQDFFYHWSGSLILIVAILIDKGFISVEESAASSLISKILKVPSNEDILEIDLIMQNHDKTPQYFDLAFAACSKIELDRKFQFLPRIILAKIQWFYSRGRFDEAKDAMDEYLKGQNSFDRQIIKDFLEMFGNGFSIRKLFERDHN
jgi:hypothetical protein